MQIRFDKADGFIKTYDGTRHLVLFAPERYDAIYNRIRYLISEKSGIKYTTNHNFARIKIDLYNYLPKEKTLTFHVIYIKPFINKNENNYYYYIFRKRSTWDKSYTNFLKELRKFILCIIPVWSVFCSVRFYISLDFLPVLLVKLGFCLSYIFGF